MIDYRLARERFCTATEGRTAWHSFSFGAHYDPTNVGFGSLVAHNEERLPPGTGYADHPHVDLEIVTWVLDGALRHTSSVGSRVIGPGQVQRLSAGSGVVHSENAAGEEPTRFLQAWVRPDEVGLSPGYLYADAPTGEGWTCVADGDGHGAVPLSARGTSLLATDLGSGKRLTLPDAPRLHLFVARGQVMLGERLLEPGDAARMLEEGGRPLRAETDAQLVVWAWRERSVRGSVRPG